VKERTGTHPSFLVPTTSKRLLRRLILSVHLVASDSLADNKSLSLVDALSPAAGVKFSSSAGRDERQRRA